jgi:hypothetical protein
VKAESLQADESSEQKVACTQPNGRPQWIGFLREGNRKVDMVCVQDYMGGIFLEYESGAPGEEGQKISLNLSQVDGDAGELWDTRARITKNKKGFSHIEVLTLTSHQDFGASAKGLPPPTCTESAKAFDWNPQNHAYIETASNGSFKAQDFRPPIEVDEKCLNDKGQWQVR